MDLTGQIFHSQNPNPANHIISIVTEEKETEREPHHINIDKLNNNHE